MHYNKLQIFFKKRSVTVKRINLDLKKLLGFKIVASQSSSSELLKISAKLGDKIGEGGKSNPKPEFKNS
jgi:hypothetical protein